MKESLELAVERPYAHIWRLALPLIIANLTIPLLGVVDTAVIGDLSSAHIGAVALGATVFTFLYWAFAFLRFSTTGLAAQAYGSGDMEVAMVWLGRSMLLATLFGTLSVSLQTPIVQIATGLVSPSPEVRQYLNDYITIRIWAGPAALANLAILGWLIGLQKVGYALFLQVIINGLNILLDIIFADWLSMEVSGVALATMISQYIGLGAGLYFVQKIKIQYKISWKLDNLIRQGPLLTLMALNRDIFLRSLLLIIATSMFTIQGSRMGELILAANGILILFLSFIAYGLDGFAHAAEALVGKAIGSRDRSYLRHSVRRTTELALLVSIVYTFFLIFFGTNVISWITSLSEVQAVAETYFLWVIISPLASVWAYQFDGIFIGATRAGDMRNAMIISFSIFLVLVLFLVPHSGNHGLWLSFTVFSVARGLTLLAFYPRLEKITTDNSIN